VRSSPVLRIVLAEELHTVEKRHYIVAGVGERHIGLVVVEHLLGRLDIPDLEAADWAGADERLPLIINMLANLHMGDFQV